MCKPLMCRIGCRASTVHINPSTQGECPVTLILEMPVGINACRQHDHDTQAGLGAHFIVHFTASRDRCTYLGCLLPAGLSSSVASGLTLNFQPSEACLQLNQERKGHGSNSTRSSEEGRAESARGRFPWNLAAAGGASYWWQ